jgi:hypothetical protein
MLGSTRRFSKDLQVYTGARIGTQSIMCMTNKNKKLPSFILDLISAPPTSGNGVHSWLYIVARHLHHHRPEGEIFGMLRKAVKGCGRDVPNKEIWEAIKNSKRAAWKPGVSAKGKASGAHSWPSVNLELRQSAVDSSAVQTLEDLNRESPVDCNPQPRTEDIIDALMPGNPLICVGKDKSKFWTRHREDFRGSLASYPLIVPSAMRAFKGKVKGEDRHSAHTLDNTGPRQYLITEFDSGDNDEQAALIWHLSQAAPLAMVVHSANKSLHAWWECAGQDESDLKRFMKHAVLLGADKVTWTRSQFVRMPGGLRDGSRPQRIHYFDPDAGKEGA